MAGFEKVEVETTDGRIQSKSTDPESIHFREGLSTQSTEANTVKADLPKIDESLHGTEYVNRTGKFSLTLPPEWIINADLRQRPVTLAGLSSSDKTRFAIVEQKEYTGSLASYKELTMSAARITLSNFEELSQSSATIDGKRAILVLYRGNIPVPPNTSVEFVTAFISRSDNNFTKVTALKVTFCGVVISRYAASIRKTRHFLSQFPPARRCRRPIGKRRSNKMHDLAVG